MEKINIFATQLKSDWVKNMLEQARHDIGHHGERWTTRAMIAFEAAGMEGKLFTTSEMEKRLSPYIGPSGSHHLSNNMAKRAIKYGIMIRTGRKRYVEGVRNPYPEYEVVGHIEIDSDTGAICPIRLQGSS